MEFTIFDKGTVKLTTLAAKLLSWKGSVFSKIGIKATAYSTHCLMLSLWVVDIIHLHSREDLLDDKQMKVIDIICAFSEKSDNSRGYCMNYCDND